MSDIGIHCHIITGYTVMKQRLNVGGSVINRISSKDQTFDCMIMMLKEEKNNVLEILVETG